MKLPFDLETDLERQLAADSDWQTGIEWGIPRRGHPEGAVKWHVAEVLANIDRLALAVSDRERLRLAALAHDTFKHQVDRSARLVPPNEHGYLAARWLEQFIDDARLIAIVELHDEGFRAWRASQTGRGDQAWRRISRVITQTETDIGLFVAFYWADNSTGDKSQQQVGWFIEQLVAAGVPAEMPPLR